MADRTIWLVAGPNGVGKTTYAFRHIRAVYGSVRFVPRYVALPATLRAALRDLTACGDG